MTEEVVLFRNAKYVVRLSQDGDDLTVFLHKVVDNVEHKPLGYMMGVNYVSTKDWK